MIFILKFINPKSQNIIHLNRVYVFQQLRCDHQRELLSSYYYVLLDFFY